jgi:hypothetical protein
MPEEPTIGVEDRALDDLALEALAEAYAVAPPAGLRQRVVGSARSEVEIERARRGRTRWRIVGGLAAMLALVLGGLLAGENAGRQRQLAELESLARTNAELTARLDTQEKTLASLRESLDAQGRVLRILGGPRTLSASLGPKEGFGGSGRVHVDAETGEGAVVLSGVQPLAGDKVYELWALRGNAPPEPAGLLAVAGQSVYLTQVAKLERPTGVTAFAVSIEPKGGSKSPTGPIVLVGSVQG